MYSKIMKNSQLKKNLPQNVTQKQDHQSQVHKVEPITGISSHQYSNGKTGKIENVFKIFKDDDFKPDDDPTHIMNGTDRHVIINDDSVFFTYGTRLQLLTSCFVLKWKFYFCCF